MNPIIQTLTELNISQDKITELFTTLTDNPMAAIATLQSLGLPAEKLKAIMMMVMSNPDLIKQAVDELGLDFSKVEQAKSKMAGQSSL